MLHRQAYRAVWAVIACAALMRPDNARGQETSSDIYINESLITELSFGLNCAIEITGSVDAPDTERGTVDVFDEAPELYPPGQIVPAMLGLGFGIKARAADGVTINGAVFRVRHLAFTPSGMVEQSWEANYSDRVFSTHLYRFDYPHEAVPGTWIMEAFYQGELLYRVPFTVISPEAYSGAAESFCAPADLLSSRGAAVLEIPET